VQSANSYNYNKIFSNCRQILGTETWGRILAALEEDSDPENFPTHLPSMGAKLRIPEYSADLARLEWLFYQAQTEELGFPQHVDQVVVNPGLRLYPFAWKHLAAKLGADTKKSAPPPEPADIHIMIWRHPKSGQINVREANDIDILALKIISEGIDTRRAATETNVTVGALDSAVDQAVREGFLLAPDSKIRRSFWPDSFFSESTEPFLSADTFTLQWHITQTCDLHCRHCYDRSERSPMAFEAARSILDNFYAFCRQMHVKGQVTFTGGNPLLYPFFQKTYRAASDLGFGVAILGNPTPIKQIESLLDIAEPAYFQVSLEGLESYNDYIRGSGHFQRSLTFIDDLRRLGIYTMVMLTLTRDNMDQVLPLARLLSERADFFTFNRLSLVGEGALLKLPRKDDFEAFLKQYEQEAESNPIMGLKDNLINIIRSEKGDGLFGGCTGYGCGAAFNFVALLPDGEVHACRKFPSLIGNMKQNSLAEIYHSKLAEKYRSGGKACQDCNLFTVCRGCLAVTYSCGLDVFKDKDPFCFISDSKP